MALALTLKFSEGFDPNSLASRVSSSFTPSNNSLLLVALHSISNTTFPTFTVSGGSLTWTKVKTARFNGSFDSFVELWAAQVTTGASMQVTATVTGGSMVSDGTNFSWTITEVTGHDVTTSTSWKGLEATDATAQGTGHSGALSVSLGGTTASSSAVVSFLVSDGDYGDGAITGTAGYTALYNFQGGTSGWFKSNDQYKVGAISNADFGSWTSAYGHCAYAVEIKAAGGGGGGTTLTATGLAGSSPSLGTPSMTVKRNLTATSFAGASRGSPTPTLSINGQMAATPFAGASPSLGSPSLTQKHALSATAFAGASPSLGAPAAGVLRALTATGFSGAAASIGAPSLTRNATIFNPNDKDAGATLSSGNLALTATASSGARSNNTKYSGKNSVRVTGDVRDLKFGAGIALAGASRVGADANSFLIGYNAAFGGWVCLSNNTITNTDGTTAAATGSDNLDIYIDSTANRLYAVANGNPLFGGNPAAGTGGIVIPSGPHFFLAAATNGSGTADFNGAAAVSGWAGWDADLVGAITASPFAGASPSLGSPALSQKHVLSATAFAGSSPSLGSPALVQKHGLSATAFAGASPSLASPTLRLSTVLNPLDKDAALVIGANGVSYTSPTGNVTGVRSVGSWKTGKHAFSLTGIFDAGACGIGISLAGASRVSEDANSGSVTFYQGNWLYYEQGVSDPVEAATVAPTPTDTLTLYCDSDANLIYVYSANQAGFLFGGNPVAGTNGISIPDGNHFALVGADAQFSGYSDVTGYVNFNPENLASGWSPWGQGDSLTHFMTASAFAGASPSIGAPTLSVAGGMAAVAFAGASPFLGTPTLGVTRNLSATSFAGGSPALGAPALGQRHSLTAVSHAGASPVLGTPTFSIAGQMAAVAFSGSSPAFTLPTLNQRHAVIATAIGTGPPALGPASLSQRHGLAATPLTGASPWLGTPALTQQHSLSATSFAGTSPGLGTPGLTQRHALSATPFAGAAAALGQPSVVLAGQMVALPLAGASPVLGLPTLVQRHVLTPTPFAGAAAALGTPVFGAAGGLTAVSFAGASPVLGTPVLKQVHALVCVSHAGVSPAIGQPAIGQRHFLAGTSISSTTSIETPFFGDVLPVVFAALGFAGSPPAMTKPYLSTTKFVPKPGRTLGGLRPRVRSLVNGKPRARSL